MRVEPSGPCPCDIAIFGEAPGWDEQLEGRGYVGKAGQQLWSDLKRFTGLTRDDVYVSNIVKDGLPKNRDPKPQEIAAALPEFMDELERVQPRVVITTGGFSTRAMLGPVKMSDVHGIPHLSTIAGNVYTCFPTYHPAAGLHNKGFLSAFAYDLGRLAAFLRGELKPWAPSGRPARTSWFSRDARVLSEASESPVVGLDTEGWEDLPVMLSYSPDGLHGYGIKADDAAALDWFRCWLNTGTPKRVPALHNGLHDIPVLRAMGVALGTFHDTQVLAYHDMLRTGSGVLEAESQNLGTLAYRESRLILGELSTLPGVDLASRVIPCSEAVMHYAGMDPIATYRLCEVYAARGLTEYRPYQIDMGQIPLVEAMIANGIPFEYEDATDYYMEVLDKLEAATTDMRKQAARYGNRDFNPGSHVQVRELITRKIGLKIRKRTKGGLASTNEKALADHQDVPFVKKLQDFRELVKLKGTYVEPLLEELQ